MPSAQANFFQNMCMSDDASIIYGIGNDLMKSTDGGQTFNIVAEIPNRSDPWVNVACSANGDVVIVTGLKTQVLYYSTNGGNTWNWPSSGVQTWDIVYKLCVSSDASRMFCATVGAGVFVSTDFGANWTATSIPTDPNRSGARVDCSADGLTVGVQTSYAGSYLSLNGGVTFNSITSIGTTFDWQSTRVAVSGNGTTIALSTLKEGGQDAKIYVSSDSGSTWNLVSLTNTASSDQLMELYADATNNIYTFVDTANSPILRYSAPVVAVPGPTLAAGSLTSNSVTISWSPVANATSYTYMLSANGAAPVAVTPSSSTSSTATFANLTASTTYSLVMTTNTPSGNRVSPALSVTTTATPVPGPTLTSSNVTSTSFTASWTPVSGVTGYTYMLSTGGGAAVAITPSSTTSSTATFTLLSPSTTYSLVMTSNTPSGNRVSPALSVTTSAAIVPGPTLTPGAITSISFTASWTPVSGVTGYTYMLSTSGGAAVAVTPSSSTSSTAIFTNLRASTTYSLVMRSNTPSGYRVSPTFVVTTTAAPVPGPTLTSSNVTSTSFTASWTPVSGVTGYTYMLSTNGGAFVAVTPSSTTSSTATFTNLTVGTSYFLIMTTNTPSGNILSPSLSIRTSAIPPPVPGPTLTSSNITSTSFTASWTPLSGVTGYTYMLSTNGGAPVAVTPSSITSSTATFSNLRASTTYFLIMTTNTPSGNNVSPTFSIKTSAVP